MNMKLPPKQSVAGFTIIELLVIMVIVAILAGIAAPGWLGFLNRQRLNSAQAEAVSAIREAQSRAKLQKRTWAACFQNATTGVRWAVNPVPANNPGWNCSNASNWQNLIRSDADKLEIDTGLSRSIDPSSPGGYYEVRFRDKGWVVGQQLDNSQALGKITFKAKNSPQGSKRCVYVATLLGAIRTANDAECNN
jgi:type II secretory pathway pseudopilin PulG